MKKSFPRKPIQPKMEFYLKYLLPKTISNEGRIKLTVLHPTHRILVLGIIDGHHEISIWEYDYTSINEKQTKIINEQNLSDNKNLKTPTFTLTKCLKSEKTDAFTNMGFSAHGKQLFVILNKSIKVFSFEKGRTPIIKLENYIENPHEIISFAAGIDEKSFAIGTLDGKVIIHDKTKNQPVCFKCDNKVVSLVWDPLGRFLCCLTLANCINIFNMTTQLLGKYFWLLKI